MSSGLLLLILNFLLCEGLMGVVVFPDFLGCVLHGERETSRGVFTAVCACPLSCLFWCLHCVWQR